ncbi:MAG: hypothetical protein ABIQ04_03590 [Candidatus Saccharimonadales bacterium]
MINLLPLQNKKDIQAGRTNLLLVRYNILLVGALLFALAAVGVLYFYLSSAKASAEQTISDNKSKVGEYAVIETQASAFRSHLVTAKQILDQEVVYTKIILQISRLVPPGVVIDNLSLDPKTFGTASVITAHCKTASDATALKESFQNTTLFSNVHFENLSSTIGDTTGYPFTVSLNVTLNKAGIQ